MRLLVSLPTLELPVFSKGVWGGTRALKWDVGVWWGAGVRWDPSHVEGTGMSWDHGRFAASNPRHVLRCRGWGVPPGEAGALHHEAEVAWESWGIGASAGLPTAAQGGQTICVGCSVPAAYRRISPSLQVTHEDVSWGPSSWRPSGNEFWVAEPRLAKLTDHPRFLALNCSEGGCV